MRKMAYFSYMKNDPGAQGISVGNRPLTGPHTIPLSAPCIKTIIIIIISGSRVDPDAKQWRKSFAEILTFRIPHVLHGYITRFISLTRHQDKNKSTPNCFKWSFMTKINRSFNTANTEACTHLSCRHRRRKDSHIVPCVG